MMLPPKEVPTAHLSSSRQPPNNSILLNEGALLIEVDDILQGGSPRHDKLMEEFAPVMNLKFDLNLPVKAVNLIMNLMMGL